MSAESIAEGLQDIAGWSDETLLGLVLQYVENQGDNPAFEDFLQKQVEEEAALSNEDW